MYGSADRRDAWRRGTTGVITACYRQLKGASRPSTSDFSHTVVLPAAYAGKCQPLAISREVWRPRFHSRRGHGLTSPGDPATSGIKGEEPSPDMPSPLGEG